MFDRMYAQSDLHHVLNQAKTLSKEECRLIFEYFERKQPRLMFEFGTQLGCSTKAFLVMAACLGLDLELHSWDIVDVVQYADKSQFHFHLQNIDTIRTFNEHTKPDVIFFDAHPYEATKRLMLKCMTCGVDFIAHDITVECYERTKKDSDGFENKSVYANWEAYLIPELIDNSLLTNDYFENDKLKVTCVRERYGVCVVEMKT